MSKTALITGASSGIGADFARQLAAQGYSLILTARRENLLKELADEILPGKGISIEIISADLAESHDMARLLAKLEGRTVDLLVNNAGFGLNSNFQNTDEKRMMDMIEVHCAASMRLARALLPGMCERRSGSIINVASLAAFLPGPGGSIYPATKAFLVSFSESLAKEFKEFGIQVQALCPGMTYTGFHDTPEYAKFNRKVISKPFWMTSEAVVQISLEALGSGKVVVIPGFLNKLVKCLFQLPLISPILWKEYNRKRKKFH